MSRANYTERTARIVVTDCWSYYNKGDAAIAIATVKLIKKVLRNAEVTLLAHDYQSFVKHRKYLTDVIRILPMPCIADSLRPLRNLFGLPSQIGLKGVFGSLFLFLSLASINLLRRVDKTLDCTLRSIDDSDLVIAVGGNYIHSHFGFYVHAIPIVYSKFVRKKRSIMLGHTIGPFSDTMSRIVSRVILSHMDLIVFREDLSHLYVKENLKVNLPNAFISSDLALSLQSRACTTYEKLERLHRVGINVRRWFLNRPDLYKRYLDSIIQTTLDLIKDGFEIFLIPFSYIGRGEDDLEPCRAIYTKASKHSKKVHLLYVKDQSPTSIVEIMRNLGLHIFIGTRMHSVILASLACVPSVTISYQHFKGHGISKQLGISKYVIDIENIKPRVLMRYVNELINNYEKERKNLIMAVQRLEKMNEQRIGSTLVRLIGDFDAK